MDCDARMLLQGASGKSEQKSSIWCGILKIDANFRAKMLLTLAFGSKIRSIGERLGIVWFFVNDRSNFDNCKRNLNFDNYAGP